MDFLQDITLDIAQEIDFLSDITLTLDGIVIRVDIRGDIGVDIALDILQEIHFLGEISPKK